MGKRYSDAAKIEIVKSIDDSIDKGMSVPEACSLLNISNPSYHKWKRQFTYNPPPIPESNMKRLTELATIFAIKFLENQIRKLEH